MSAANCCSHVRFGFFGSFDKKSEPSRQYFVAAAASRLKLRPKRRNVFIQTAPDLVGRPAFPKITFGSARSTRLFLPLPSIHALPTPLLQHRFARPLAQVGDDALFA